MGKRSGVVDVQRRAVREGYGIRPSGLWCVDGHLKTPVLVGLGLITPVVPRRGDNDRHAWRATANLVAPAPQTHLRLLL